MRQHLWILLGYYSVSKSVSNSSLANMNPLPSLLNARKSFKVGRDAVFRESVEIRYRMSNLARVYDRCTLVN